MLLRRGKRFGAISQGGAGFGKAGCEAVANNGQLHDRGVAAADGQIARRDLILKFANVQGFAANLGEVRMLGFRRGLKACLKPPHFYGVLGAELIARG